MIDCSSFGNTTGNRINALARVLNPIQPSGSVFVNAAAQRPATPRRLPGVTMRSLLIFALFPAAWAQTSLQVTSGTVTVTIPNSAPYTTLGIVSQPLRWEFRLHSFGTNLPHHGMSAISYETDTYVAEGYPGYLFANSTHDIPDSFSGNGIVLSPCCSGRTDVLIRLQRDVINNQVTAEICDVATGTNCMSGAKAITAHTSDSLAGLVINITSGQSIAFLRWFSTAVPVGTPIGTSGVTGDLGDWEFENSLSDSSSNRLGLTLNGATIRYVATPSYPPVCSAGTSQSFRADQSAGLDGTGSSTFGNPLTYAWTQTSGPTVTLTGATTATPSIASLPAGDYTFSLSVTDSAGPYTSTCSVEYGVVNTGDDNIVITRNRVVDTLLGPMIRYGANPWPWFDDRHRVVADLVIASLGTSLTPSRNYSDFWQTTKGPGTIAITTDGTTVTGSGTTFTTTFCQGPAYPTVPKMVNPSPGTLHIDGSNNLMVMDASYNFPSVNIESWVNVTGGTGWTVGWYLITSVSSGAAILDHSPSVAGNTNTGTYSFYSQPATKILVWYPNNSLEGYGLRGLAVVSCQSDTQMTTWSNYPWQGDVADCNSGGCSYSSDDGGIDATGGGIWTYPGGEGSNYYDDVAGLYALYYRSGLTTYQTAARTLADRFWKYRLGSGTLCNSSPGVNACGGSNEPRTQSLLGMVLRATDGRPDMWPGLESMFTYYMTFLNHWDLESYWGLWDIREESYQMAMISYCAMFDPDSTFRSNCESALSAAMNGLWNVTQAPDGSWQGLDYVDGSWSGPTSVSLTNGDTHVTGNGTSWTSGEFPVNQHMIFLPTTDKPANIQAQVEGVYYTPTFVDGQHLTLDRPYAGTTGTHGWLLGDTEAPPNLATGWGGQPYINGINGVAFEFTAQALRNSDPVNAKLAHEHNLSIARWEMNYGYRSAVKGMQYFAGHVDCLPPITESMVWCNGDETASQSRTLSAETLRSVMLAYVYSKDPTLLAFGDTLYNAMYAKAGTCATGSTACAPDVQYLTDLDSGTGWYVIGDPMNNKWHKWFGMFFGIGAGSDWPAYRIQGTP
jgi:hypothetical protein